MDKNMNLITLTSIVIIAFAALFMAFNSGEVKVTTVNQEQQNSISVSGNAKLEVEPDKAEVYVRIETFNAKADDAKDENAKTADQVIKALKRNGIENDDIETTSFYLNPRYDYDRVKGESILKGYTATNVLKVTTKNIDDAGKIIDTAVDNGANSIQSVNFGLSKEKQKEVSGEALIRAAQVAKEKAESLTASLGINLGKVISVQESNFNFIPFAAPMMEMDGMAIKAESAATQVIPGNVEVRASVNMAYEIS
jgi:uncharacterized protein YggE|tara:strand:- start:15132 stop:15890 length:759 start_codon:yes stop_codon:yes gene_type:complete